MLLLVWVPLFIQAQPRPEITAAIAQISTDSLLKTLVQLSGQQPVQINGQTDTIRSRQFDQPGNEKAFQYLKQRLLQSGLVIDSQVFSSTGKNLFGMIEGSHPNELVIVGAHYDAVGSVFSPGADDNGSGVAAVLECARICQQLPMRPTVMFALWDEEETGSIGSAAYVRQRLMPSGNTFLGYLNLDMIGWDGNNDGIAQVHTRTIGQSNRWAGVALDVNTNYSIGLQLQPILQGYGATDVASFWDNQYTAIGIVEDYDNDRSPHQHSPNDTAGSLNLPYLRKTTQLTLGTLLTFSLAAPAAVQELTPSGWNPARPNPFTTTLTLQGPADSGHPVRVLITDAMGRTQVDRTFLSQTAVQLDTRTWPAGWYQVVLFQDDRRFVQKVIRIQ